MLRPRLGFSGLRTATSIGFRTVTIASVLLTLWIGLAGFAAAAEGPDVVPLDGATDAGDLAGLELQDDVIAMAATSSGDGYWLVASDGGVFAFGDAGFFGSTGSIDLVQPVVAMAPTPTNNGYWLVASDGGVFAFGDAVFRGSMGGVALSEPVVGIASTPTGDGYWLVASDGGIFSFGDAVFHGSTGAISLNEPITSMAVTDDGAGYWLLARDGGIFTFGSALFSGSGLDPQRSQDALAIGTENGGYWVLYGDGQVSGFGPVVLDPSPQAICQSVAVRGGVVSTQGAWWFTTSVEVQRPGFISSASTIDSNSIAEQLSYVQACQPVGVPASEDFISPVPGRISSVFGSRIHPIWGVSILHGGTDIAAPSGTPFGASAAGVVIAVDQRSAYGLTVVVDHGNRVATVYAHLTSTFVAVGDLVAQGETLGTIGNSGFVTGPHLHVEVRVNGIPVNPGPLLGI